MNNHSANAGRHALKDRRDDLYETPAPVVMALLKVEQFEGPVWEPACGNLAIVNVLLKQCYKVVATDLVCTAWPGCGCGTQSGPHHCGGRIDFLMERNNHGCRSIVTNPPYKLANEFVRHAIALCPKVAMLLRLQFLESDGRSDILERGGLARVHVFRNRLPMMHRDGWEGKRATSSQAFAWFVWDREHKGPPTINRISWEPTK